MSESTLYFNGTIYTMDGANTCCSAMLVTDGKIAATGSDADLLAGKPENAQTVDLQGRVVLPGLVEGHTHVAITGRRMLELELSGKSKEEKQNCPKGGYTSSQCSTEESGQHTAAGAGNSQIIKFRNQRKFPYFRSPLHDYMCNRTKHNRQHQCQ